MNRLDSACSWKRTVFAEETKHIHFITAKFHAFFCFLLPADPIQAFSTTIFFSRSMLNVQIQRFSPHPCNLECLKLYRFLLKFRFIPSNNHHNDKFLDNLCVCVYNTSVKVHTWLACNILNVHSSRRLMNEHCELFMHLMAKMAIV